MNVKFPNPIFEIDKFLVSQYLISPYSNGFLEKNLKIFKNEEPGAFDDLNDHKKRGFYIVKNGRTAIWNALKNINLNWNDEVWIKTSSSKQYVSNCVTTEIGKFCKWSFERSDKTKLVYVIHDFGYVRQPMGLSEFKGLVTVEDCAYLPFGVSGFDTTADFAIFSFPKTYPVSYGGALISKQKLSVDSSLDNFSTKFIEANVRYFSKTIKSNLKKRLENWFLYNELLENVGIQPYYRPEKGDFPGAFVLKFDELIGVKVKELLNASGIQSSVYYGCGGYFLPCHQNLNKNDVCFIVQKFLKVINSI